MNHTAQRRWNQEVTFKLDEILVRDRLGPGKFNNFSPVFYILDGPFDIESIRFIDSTVAVANGDHLATFLRQKTGGVAAHVSESLDDHLSAAKRNIILFRRRFDDVCTALAGSLLPAQ